LPPQRQADAIATVDHHMGAGAGQGLRDFEAETAPGAGDQRDLSV